MKLSIKLPLAFGIALLLMFSGAIYGIASLNDSIVEYNTTVQARVADERAVTKMLVTFKTQVQEWKDTLLRGEDPVKLDKYWAAFLKGEQAVSDQAKALQDSLPPGKSRDLIKQFAAAHVAMGVGYRKGHDMFVAASFDPTVGDKVVAGVDREPARLLDEAAQEIAKESIAVSAKTAEAARTALVVSSALMLVAFGLGLAGAFIFSRTITKPLARAADVASAVSHGDLAKPFDSRGSDEIGQLLHALKQMQTNLANVVSEVRRNAEGVAAASSQIAAGNLNLSSRTEEQAASLEETAANIGELTSTVRRNSESAVQASSLAGHASDTAVRGGKVMNEVVQTMQGISESSAKVGEIIGVIDSIAFQTNILALNAAVEAARAGEQGRGFAVVAGEVRTLAQRSASAAKEIKGLISQSTERVEAGARLVHEAGTIIDDIVTSVHRVTQIVGEISAASAEQSTGIDQVNVAVGQIEEVTQQNAALVEEASAAAHAMAEQADSLRRAVAVFKLRDSARSGSRSLGGSRQAPSQIPSVKQQLRLTVKKTLLAVTIAAGTVPAAAFAQSSNVTLYGIVDAGVSYQSHVNGGANGNGSVTALTSGGLSGSRWGIRGAEDLGNNLKGIFVLESGFDIDTGKSAQGSRLFGRQAYVGLQGDFGAVTLGRQQNALYDLFAAYDPMAVGPNYSLNSVDNQFNGRADNAVKYTAIPDSAVKSLAASRSARTMAQA
ncbi:hypothetical protein DL771_011381 [Monosporascus sp. 5C6A]|nr:hypothetical protein DL771_011381 [Monosporascus sp. 5C6A]